MCVAAIVKRLKQLLVTEAIKGQLRCHGYTS